MAKKELNEGLDLDVDDPLYKLITDIPDAKSNPQGKAARNDFVGEIKMSTPGYAVYQLDLVGRSAFSYEFYPDTYRKLVFGRPDVRSITGISQYDWWKDLSVAVLCQSMNRNTSCRFKTDLISSDLQGYNSTIKNSAMFRLYEHTIEHNFMKYNGDYNKAKNDYIKNICTSDWVNYKMLLYESGRWADGAWELFHHWLKLKILGASDSEITSTIQELRELGLKIFDEVDEHNWSNYRNFFDPDKIDGDDIEEESKRHQTKTVTYTDGLNKSWEVEEGVSLHFCNEYHANKYYIWP
jgi:hypothetical protein